MVTVRVFLKCAASTNRPGGDFDTFIALPTHAFLEGLHIDIAKFRAAVIGYGGPYEVTEVRRIDARPMPVDEVREKLSELLKASSQRRLSASDQREKQIVSSNPAAVTSTTSRVNHMRWMSGR